MTKTNRLLILAMAASATVAVEAALIVSLADDFDTGIAGATDNQDLNRAARQSGTDADNSWEPLGIEGGGGENENNYAPWADRVSVTDAASGHQLRIATGGGEQALWNPGQSDLVQNSIYKVSFDIATVSGAWSFVGLNTTLTDAPPFAAGALGLLVYGDGAVGIWENGIQIEAVVGSTPTGANGLSNIEVTVNNGSASIVVNGLAPVVRDWSSFGTGTTGIGTFSVLGESVSETRMDNFVYSIDVIPEPATLGLMAGVGGTVLFIRRRFII